MSNTSPIKDCPFCLDNKLVAGTVLAKSENAYLLQSEYSPENYLVIPNIHTESPLDLPDEWWQDVKGLLRQAPDMPEHYNISINLGSIAGQTVKHLHFWVVPRQAGRASSEKGLLRLIKEIDSTS